ncbi:hybrid signal transduction histidine kinase A isoform X3 [Apis cerana]|uniref:hybrid signal transduction histidine kinase A isoform X3 n=1 Tax=Apis cerana TaxID=7461 RepID=UPI0007E2B4C1|nr:hybrid signal transduction histidine kinase A isoform X3 [Apis cerana]
MSYHRGGQAGAVAVSYSTSPMAPHSPSRRCSSNNSGNNSSAIGTSTSKLNTYRSTASSSILDRPTNFYSTSSSTSSSSGSSGFRSNYTTEYRRSYCPSGSFYSSTGTSIRRSYLSEYNRSRCSPTRSVSSSAYSSTGSGSGTATNVTTNGTSGTRFGLSTSSSSSSISAGSSSRDRGIPESSSRLEITADLIRYSPSGYIPNIRQTTSTTGSTSGIHHHHHHHHQWKHHSTGSSLTELFGGDDRDIAVERTGRDHRPESSLSSSSSSSSCAVGGALWSRSKRRPLSSSTVLNSGHARADSAASPGEVTINERGTIRDLDEDDDDDDDNNDDEDDNNTDDDQHNNNGNNGNNSSGAEDTCDSARYGLNNNNRDRDRDHDRDSDDKDDDDEDDEDNKLNNRHHRQQQQQRGAAHRIDEVSPAKRNLLSSIPGGGAGGAGLIGVKLDLLTNLATNPSNGELLINNNAQKIIRGVEEKEEDVEIRDEAGSRGEVIHGINDAAISIDAIAFLRGGRTGDPESLEHGEEQRTASTSYDIDQTGFVGGITPPILQNGVAGRPSGTYGDDPSVPSTSRRPDGHFTGTNTASNLTSSSPTAPSTAHQNLYRGVADQFEGSPTNKSARNRLQAHRDERCGLNGLRNIGNTCFMNSVIQCLSNTRPLLEYLLNEQYLADINTSTSSMKGALIKAFSQVIHELWEVGGDLVVNTTALKSQIQRFAPRFMGYSQQDAQEFLRYLLEGLHEDVNRVTIKPQPIHTDIPEMYTDSQKAVESWKRYLRSEDSMIVDVFVGQLRSSLHCTSCDHVSVTLDPFWDLSLPIPARSGTVKLSQCLEHFTREEVLDGDEKPTCSKCQMRRKCTKSFSIQKFPKILVIHLKRFSPMERFRSKLNVMVDFPLTGLDLSAFAAPRVPGCTYNLYGVANHSGTTHSGHYTAYCKHPYSAEWHEYNDSRVSAVPARSVVSNEAYVLFYEQQPHSSHL